MKRRDPERATSLDAELTAAEIDRIVEGAQCVVIDFHQTLCSGLFFATSEPPVFEKIERLFWQGAPELQHRWMTGEVTAQQIARHLSGLVHMPADVIEAALREGCRSLPLNEAVWAFARSARAAGKGTALVTVNADVFSEEIVPAHGLDRVFETIVNSADHGTTDKRRLWPIAFDRLGDGIGYADSFLIEDGEQSPRQFIEAGGWAYRYHDDVAFANWIESRCC